MQQIKVIESADCDEFERDVNDLLSNGYRVLSSNCGFVNSEKYDFCSSYQAILINNMIEFMKLDKNEQEVVEELNIEDILASIKK
jgi:hypothetical protein